MASGLAVGMSAEEAYVQVELHGVRDDIERLIRIDWSEPAARTRMAADLRRIAGDLEEIA